MIDVEKIRADFPYLDSEKVGKEVIYLDTGATSQKPAQPRGRCVQENHGSHVELARLGSLEVMVMVVGLGTIKSAHSQGKLDRWLGIISDGVECSQARE